VASHLMSAAARPTALLMLAHYSEEQRGGIEIVAAALARELASLGFAVPAPGSCQVLRVEQVEAC
jgi:hypothetical protein